MRVRADGERAGHLCVRFPRSHPPLTVHVRVPIDGDDAPPLGEPRREELGGMPAAVAHAEDGDGAQRLSDGAQHFRCWRLRHLVVVAFIMHVRGRGCAQRARG